MRTINEESTVYPSEVHSFIKDEKLTSVTINDQCLAGSRVISSTYQTVVFSRSVFMGCTFKQTIFTDCVFDHCSFEFSHLSMCHFVNCTFKDCSWIACSSKDSVFLDCELDHSLSMMSENVGNKVEFSFGTQDEQTDFLQVLAA